MVARGLRHRLYSNMKTCMDCESIKTREDLPALLNGLDCSGAGAEVGVRRGSYSEFLLDNCRIETLFSIDRWTFDPTRTSKDNEDYVITVSRLLRFGTRSVHLRMESSRAAELFPAAYFDFIYIDADHRRDSVFADLSAWYPKMRPGGVFSGHDYGNIPDVKNAVDDFMSARKKTVYITKEDQPSWFVLT